MDSDHWPVLSKIQVRFKKKGPTVGKRTAWAYTEVSGEDARRFNIAVTRDLAPVWGTGGSGEARRAPTSMSPAAWAKALTGAAEAELPREQTQIRRNRIRPRTWDLLKQRSRLREEGVDRSEEGYKSLEKTIKREVRGDKREYLRSTIDGALTEKHQWKAIRQLKQGYQPRMYGRRDRHGRMVAIPLQAEASAEYLAREHWADGSNGAPGPGPGPRP